MRGFLTLAQNGKYDYVKMAYVLAMSLKLSQKEVTKLSVIVNKNSIIPEKYKKFFDKIIYIDDIDSEWKVNNKYQYYNLTPYEETIVLDTDMLFFNDISSWWEVSKYSNLEFTTQVINYKEEIVTSDYYRKVFTTNTLPNLYTGLFYFKKSKEIKEYFQLVKIIFENWKEFYKYLKNPPKYLSGDVAFSLAAKILFAKDWSSSFTFTHMRGRLQENDIFGDWNKELITFFTNYHKKIELKINNYNQFYPFHYIKKTFLTDEILGLYEENTLHLLR